MKKSEVLKALIDTYQQGKKGIEESKEKGERFGLCFYNGVVATSRGLAIRFGMRDELIKGIQEK